MWNKEHPDTSELLISIFIARGNILISGTDKENREKMRSFLQGNKRREKRPALAGCAKPAKVMQAAKTCASKALSKAYARGRQRAF